MIYNVVCQQILKKKKKRLKVPRQTAQKPHPYPRPTKVTVQRTLCGALLPLNDSLRIHAEWKWECWAGKIYIMSFNWLCRMSGRTNSICSHLDPLFPPRQFLDHFVWEAPGKLISVLSSLSHSCSGNICASSLVTCRTLRQKSICTLRRLGGTSVA